jgi:gamma-glutamylcyclotransferase (GGCT)/AIG2-like uncharacterized protein YtfP
MAAADRRLFVYGSLLRGEKDHALIEGRTRLGECNTEPAFHLVDLGPWAALVAGGSTAVAGELYSVDLPTLVAIDVALQVPVLFKRARIRMADGSEADAYAMDADQVRGRRKLHHGDWRKRFTGHVAPLDSPFAKWARGRR